MSDERFYTFYYFTFGKGDAGEDAQSVEDDVLSAAHEFSFSFESGCGIPDTDDDPTGEGHEWRMNFTVWAPDMQTADAEALAFAQYLEEAYANTGTYYGTHADSSRRDPAWEGDNPYRIIHGSG